MSNYINNNKCIPLSSSKKSIDKKLSENEFKKNEQNKYKLHKLIKNDRVVQDKAILPSIFGNQYGDISDIINMFTSELKKQAFLAYFFKYRMTIYRSLVKMRSNYNQLSTITSSRVQKFLICLAHF